MQSKFYQADEQRAEKVNQLFSTIARRYDLLNDFMSLGMHRRWKSGLVQLAGEPVHVLDLCCGTGDIARRFRGKVVGADFTHAMLQVAQARGKSDVIWVQADALRLPFPDATFDVVSVGYGLRNLADLEQGLREMLRVLRPGGKLLSLDFGKPEAMWLRKMFFAHLRFHMPLMGRWSCGDPDAYSYILTSLEHYPAQRGVKELMVKCGFAECGFKEYVGGTMAINYGIKPSAG